VIFSVEDEDNGSRFRAKATNTQIEEEELSAFTYFFFKGFLSLFPGQRNVVSYKDDSRSIDEDHVGSG
jgi:hypothetical protein